LGREGSKYDFYYDIDGLYDYPRSYIAQNVDNNEITHKFEFNNLIFRLPKIKLQVYCDVKSSAGTSTGKASIYLFIKLEKNIENLSNSLIYFDLTKKLSDVEFKKRSEIIKSVSKNIENDYNYAKDENLFRNKSDIIVSLKGKKCLF
jgi:hypothetical protein